MGSLTSFVVGVLAAALAIFAGVSALTPDTNESTNLVTYQGNN